MPKSKPKSKPRRRQRAANWQCEGCKLKRGVEGGPDPCWGYLPGVSFACCGHGGDSDCYGYILFSNGVRISVTVHDIERPGFPPVKLSKQIED